MIFGVTKPRIVLLDGASDPEEDITMTVAPKTLVPSFIPDLIKQRAQDGSLTVINRGHWVEIDAYFPSITDTQFSTVIDILKKQFDYDANNDYNQYAIRIYPHYTDSVEYYDGHITTPIDIINEFHNLTHGLRFKFEGRDRLALNTFLMSNTPNAPTSPVTDSKTSSSVQVSWTAPSSGCDGYMVIVRATTAPTAGPVNGTVYAVADTIGSGTVKKYGTGLNVNVTGLTTGTLYHFKIYAYKGSLYNVTYSAVLSHTETTS